MMQTVLDEAVTAVRRKTKNHSLAVRAAKMTSGSKMVTMSHVTKSQVSDALAEYRNHRNLDLSFTDWVITCQIREKGLHGIISFDEHFDDVKIARIQGPNPQRKSP